MRLFAAVVLAVATAVLYALSTALQALEARRTPREAGMHASLIARLVRRPLWLAGTAAGGLAWPMQAGALALASVALVQPALGLGLVVLLALAVRLLGERVHRREVAGALAIAAGVALLAWAAPSANGRFSTAASIAILVAGAAVAAVPYVLRALGTVSGMTAAALAGVGWGVVGFATAALDEAVGHRHWAGILVWFAVIGAASWSSLLSEMTSLQTCPATRSMPVTYALEMAWPAAVMPVLTTSRPAHSAAFGFGLLLAAGGAVALGRSGTVARAVER